MRKSISITFILTCLVSFGLYAQQNAQYSQYMFHGLYVNPAYSGYRGDLNLHSYYRVQWTEMEGSPRTLAFAADMALDNDKVGLGLNILNDRLGLERRTSAYINYAYRLRFDRSGTRRLAIGLGAGFVNWSMDSDRVRTNDPEPLRFERFFLPDVRIGIYYYSPSVFAGLGAENLLSSAVFNDENASIRPMRHYYLHGGGLIYLADEFMLKPSTLIKTASNVDNQAWTVDLNAALIVAEQFTVGASYRSGFFTGDQRDSSLPGRNSVIALAEFRTSSNIRVGYSYDYPLSSTIGNLGSTHEISIGYAISKQKVRERTPRFF